MTAIINVGAKVNKATLKRMRRLICNSNSFCGFSQYAFSAVAGLIKVSSGIVVWI